jgi:hypothetical protein
VSQRVSRADVIGMLDSYRSRSGEPAVLESVDSLELAWLLHQVEQRYGQRLDLDDDQLAAMSTVDGAVAVLDEAMAR